MARRNSVEVIIKAKDQASKKFRTIGGAAGSMGSMLKKAAGAALVYFSARAVKNFVQSSLDAFGRQEAAVKKLADALELLGIKDRAALKDLEKFASSIQKTTTYGDEAVIELMAMGAAMGKLSGDELKKATKAAIGLAAAYKMDVTAAMRLVARAAAGDTATLARYGIKLGDLKTNYEKFNKVLEIGAKNFALAEGETKTYLGVIEQTKNALGDVKEVIGEAIMPVFKEWAIRTREWAENNKKAIGDWAKKAVAYVALVKDVFMLFVDFMKKDWRTGLSYAFDAMLTIVKTAFKSAVTMAFVAGGAIYDAIQEGLLGQKKGAIKIATLDLLKKFEPGVVKQRNDPELRRKSYKQLNKEYFTVGTGLGGTRYIARENQEKYEKYKKLAEESYIGTNVKKAIGESLNIVTKEWAAAMKDIAGGMPSGMTEDVNRAFAKYQQRLLGITADETGYAVNKPLDWGSETVKDKKIKEGKKGKWSPLESRFLTMAPGSTLDIDRRTERNTRDAAVALKDVKHGITEIVKLLKNPNGGMQLGITNFS